MEEKILQYLEAFERAAADFGPQAVDLALAYARIQSIGYLIVGVFFAILTVCTVMYGVKSFKESDSWNTPIMTDVDEAGGVFCMFLAVVFAFPTAINLFYIWNWIGAFYPELRLVHQIVGGN